MNTTNPMSSKYHPEEIVSLDTVVTHDGPFHADDVMAVALLRNATGDYAEITRSRDRDFLERAKKASHVALVDVGGEYDPSRRLFDHHFVGSPKSDEGLPLASAGMVWKYLNYPSDCWQHDVVSKIDSVDTGTQIPGWQISLVVHQCNPLTNNSEDFDKRFEHLTTLFMLALLNESETEFVETVLNDKQVRTWVDEFHKAQQESRKRVRAAISEAERILVLSSYEPALIDVAHEAKPETLFSVYPSPSGGYMVQQIPTEARSFRGRLQLPEQWAGKRDEELSEIVGISGCIFVHPGRFIGGARTLDGAIEMANKAIEISNKEG